MNRFDKELSGEWTASCPGEERIVVRMRNEGIKVFKRSNWAKWRGCRSEGNFEAEMVGVCFR